MATGSATDPIGPTPNRLPSGQPSASTGCPKPWRTPGCALLIQLRETLGRQIIAGRGSAGELRGLLHLQGVQRPEFGNLLEFAVSGAIYEAWEHGGSRPVWVALNVDDSRGLAGPQDRLFVSGAAIIQSRVLPRGTFVTGACSPLTVRLSVESLCVWVEPPGTDRDTPIVAAALAELDYLRPSAFVVAQFGRAPVLDPNNMPRFEATDEEWAELDRIIRERRGR